MHQQPTTPVLSFELRRIKSYDDILYTMFEFERALTSHCHGKTREALKKMFAILRNDMYKLRESKSLLQELCT